MNFSDLVLGCPNVLPLRDKTETQSWAMGQNQTPIVLQNGTSIPNSLNCLTFCAKYHSMDPIL